jgi:transposase
MDIHKNLIVACAMGKGIKKEIRSFSGMTEDLMCLRDWLREKGVTHVAMESTGVYWKPVFNILEDDFEVCLVNARYVKHVPGRKTDVCDSEWLCRLLRAGLLRGSFIPPRDIRRLRDLTRYERKLTQTISAEKNRVQKVLEDANIKLSSVVSDTFGVSGMDMIDALIRGETNPDELAEYARGRLKGKKPELVKALQGFFTTHHRIMLQASLDHIRAIESIIASLDQEIAKLLEPYQEEYDLLQTIPGVKEKAAASLIAEIGTDMDRFPSDKHLCRWAGIAPGNNETSGKKKSGRITHGSKCLKATLTESAWAASRKKDTYLRSKYQSLVGRRGKKRALVAVGHKILLSAYHILKDKVAYADLGSTYLDQLRKKRSMVNYLTKRLQNLGYNVTLEVAA